MIVREAFEDYVGMVYTYSDRGMMIRSVSDGEEYARLVRRGQGGSLRDI